MSKAEEMLRVAEQFRRTEAADWGAEIERTSTIPEGLWGRLRELGLLSLTQPEWAGGLGLGLVEYFPILEEIARCHGSIRMVVHAYNSIWRTVGNGRKEQQEEWVPKVARGEALVAFALTEPGNGTGIDLRTTATYEKGHYILNGTKHLITFADRADVIVVIAKTHAELGRQGLTAFLVRKNQPGMTMEDMPHMMGDKGCSHAILRFVDCKLKEDDVLGEVGGGFDLALRGFLDQSRACIAQSAVGVAAEALHQTISFVLQRTTFGKSLASRQAVQMRLAEMALQVQAGRLLCREAARKFDAGEELQVDSSMAKAFAIQMVGDVTDGALSLHGGIGYCVGSPVERLYRDARSLWFEEGTAEMQKMTIVESLLQTARRAERSNRQ
ncbi:acyl-CoA dehydrogenase family protein [Alicyclobacillus sp. SP_1]|uniref:acyl-CoA dehydrogenase family protein n=1 Tax=Alicyclobacillus sp. SP_1 TaxID=2942475 RepID=UPI0021582194|nr:acyl-CoA dehydrogenase family protein [Alicyclobacillus sp. SP_1]